MFNVFAPAPEQIAAATKPSQKNDQDSKNPISSPDQNQDLPAARKTLQIAQERQKQLNQYKADANQRYEDAQKGRTSVNEVANRTNSKVQITKDSNSMNGKSRLQASKLSMSPQDIQSNSSRINASGINDSNAGASGFNDALHLQGRSLEGTTLLQKFGYFAGATVGLAAGVITGEAEAVLLVRGIEYVQGMGATTSVVKGASEQLGKVGLFKIASKGAINNVEPAIKIGPSTTQEVNASFVQNGMKPPYDEGIRPRTIQLQNDKTLVRVHGEDNQARGWMMRPKEIEGLTPPEIQDKFALPQLPTYVSEVNLPAGTYLRVGRVAPQPGWGNGSGMQYQALNWLDESLFQNKRLLIPEVQPVRRVQL